MGARSGERARRIAHYRFGDPQDVLRVEDSPPPPALGAGAVRVRVSRSIIHPGDLQLVAAKYSPTRTEIPAGRVPGSEAVGVVEEAAAGALDGTGIAVGGRVAFRGQGAWQSNVVVPASGLVAVPEDISDEVATQLLVNTLTARHVLRIGLKCLGARPAHIVQTAAASSVGKLITALALRDGLHPIRLVRSQESAARLAASVPGGELIVTDSAGWQDAVRKAAAGDVALVLDGVGGPMVAEIGWLLNTGGVMVSFGRLDDGPADLTMFVPKGLTLRGATIGTYRGDTPAEEQAADVALAIDLARTHPRAFAGYRTFALSDLDAAIAAVTASAKTGNVILEF